MTKRLLIIFLLAGIGKSCATELHTTSFTEEDSRVPKRFTQLSSYFSDLERQNLLKLLEENSFHVTVCVEAAIECEKRCHFVPPQRIFLWFMQMPRRAIMHTLSHEIVQSFLASFATSIIPSLAGLSSERLSEVVSVLRSLPRFFTVAAFNEINEGFLEGESDPHQKWINVGITCQAIRETTALIPDKEMELASRLMLFMQRRSIDLIPYYVEILAADFSKLEENYYPFYCLSRKLKGHDTLQDMLLRQLKCYGTSLILAKKLHREINAKSLTKGAAVDFISRMITSDSPSAELLALPE